MRIRSSQFHYHSHSKEFTAYASDLGVRFLAEDGFDLVSERTGRVVQMRLVRPRYDREGDLTHWEFTPVDCDAFRCLTIFND